MVFQRHADDGRGWREVRRRQTMMAEMSLRVLQVITDPDAPGCATLRRRSRRCTRTSRPRRAYGGARGGSARAWSARTRSSRAGTRCPRAGRAPHRMVHARRAATRAGRRRRGRRARGADAAGLRARHGGDAGSVRLPPDQRFTLLGIDATSTGASARRPVARRARRRALGGSGDDPRAAVRCAGRPRHRHPERRRRRSVHPDRCGRAGTGETRPLARRAAVHPRVRGRAGAGEGRRSRDRSRRACAGSTTPRRG